MSNNETLTRSIYGSFHFPFVSDAFCIKEIRAPSQMEKLSRAPVPLRLFCSGSCFRATSPGLLQLARMVRGNEGKRVIHLTLVAHP